MAVLAPRSASRNLLFGPPGLSGRRGLRACGATSWLSSPLVPLRGTFFSAHPGLSGRRGLRACGATSWLSSPLVPLRGTFFSAHPGLSGRRGLRACGSVSRRSQPSGLRPSLGLTSFLHRISVLPSVAARFPVPFLFYHEKTPAAALLRHHPPQLVVHVLHPPGHLTGAFHRLIEVHRLLHHRRAALPALAAGLPTAFVEPVGGGVQAAASSSCIRASWSLNSRNQSVMLPTLLWKPSSSFSPMLLPSASYSGTYSYSRSMISS